MADDDSEDQRPRLKVVSENPDLPARAQREANERAHRDRKLAEQALAELAATIVRTLAGSETASFEVMRRINEYVDAHNRLRESTGRGMTLGDEQRVLFLKGPKFDGTEDHQRTRDLIDDAYHTIVTGALRLAAHRILDERPHFGGKYSTELIEAGIRDLQDVRERNRRKAASWNWSATEPRQKKAPPRAASPKSAEPAPKQRPILKGPTGGKSKRWSPLESKSWRDLKNKDD